MRLTSETLKIDIKNLKAEENLSECGLDSIMFTTITKELNEYYGLHLNPAILYEYNNLKNFSRIFITATQRKNIGSPSYAISKCIDIYCTNIKPSIIEPKSLPVIRETVNAETGGIAIIGMSGIFPGSSDLESFWENLAAQKDLITEIPTSRWDAHVGGGIKWGGFIEGIDEFDAISLISHLVKQN